MLPLARLQQHQRFGVRLPVKPPIGELKVGNQFAVCPRRGIRIGNPRHAVIRFDRT
jgi:hypothetical protein